MAKGATSEALEHASRNDYLVLDERFIDTSRWAKCYIGGTIQARMDAIRCEIRELMDKGVPADEVMILCATPSAEGAFEAYLDMSDILVSTPRQIGVDILGEEAAQSIIGRTFNENRVRICSAFEFDFVLEDLKSIGVAPKRLREVMKFLQRGWTELADEAPYWLVTVEEQEITEFIHKELKYLQAVHPCEITNFAVKAVRESEQIRKSFGRRYVFVLGYEYLSRASQLLCCALATDGIGASMGEDSGFTAYEDYPYLSGIDEFYAVNPRAEKVELGECATIREACTENPEDDIMETIARVESTLKKGTAPEQIGVVNFNKRWQIALSRELRARGIAVDEFYEPLNLRGDVRYLESALAFRMITILHLLDNINDSLSWRAWIGYGDYLTNSMTFVPARDGIMEERPDAVFSVIAEEEGAVESLKPLLQSCEGLTGKGLLKHLAIALSVTENKEIPGILQGIAELGDNATPREMLDELEREQYFAGFSGIGVKVGSIEAFAGVSVESLFACGMVNGLFPKHVYFELDVLGLQKQERMGMECQRMVRSLQASGERDFVAGYFKAAPRALAEETRMKCDRLLVGRDGENFARVSKCIFLPEREK